MGTSGKERQKKYIEKKRLEGKQPVTVLLSQVTKEILEFERKTTGENLSTIIERAVKNMKTTVTTDNDVSRSPTVSTTSHKSKKKKKPLKQDNLELF